MVIPTIAGLFRFALVVSLSAAPVRAQERRAVVVGTIGGAGLGHADSAQGHAPAFGAGVGFHLTARLVVDGDVHTARVSHVFGRGCFQARSGLGGRAATAPGLEGIG